MKPYQAFDSPRLESVGQTRVPGIILAVLAFLILGVASVDDYLLFHAVAEIFSAVVAAAIFLIVWNCRSFVQNGFLLFIGSAFLFVGALDLVHMLAYQGMGVFKGYGTNLATQLWLAARFVEALSLLIAPAFIRRTLRVDLVLATYITASVAILFLAFGRLLPVCHVEGVGLTSFKVYSEYVICAILGGALWVLTRYRTDLDRRIYLFIVASIVCTILSELAFSHYLSPYSYTNILGHFLKIASFYLIYRALIQEALKRPYSLLFRDLEQAKIRLEEAKDDLETRVRERTAELSESRERILADQATLAALTEELLMTEEREKRRIATSLHDGIGQILAFTKREIGGMEKTASPDDKVRLAELRGQVDLAIKQTRDLTSDLSPSTLYSFGLEAALEEMATEFSRQGSFVCHVHKEGRTLELSDQLKILLYRSVRELLVNAVRHAHARNVHIHLLGHDGTVTVQVEDDGQGFDVSSLQTSRLHTAGFGLLGIRERLTHLGGEVSIESALGKGTEIRLTVPGHPDGPSERRP